MTGQELRALFNQNYTPEKYARFQQLVAERTGAPVAFRLCETPCFFDVDFMQALARNARELLEQLMNNREYLEASNRAIPDAYRVPDEPARPLFLQVDFGVIRDENGDLQPRLVEIQGFPSLYAFQPVLAQAYIDAYGLPSDLRSTLDGLDLDGYWAVLRTAIVGDHDPENVILMEIDPEHQKTLCDFLVTEQKFGVRAVCITRIKQEGRKLFYEQDGRLIPIHRIYNRAIADELDRKGIPPAFDWRDDLDVEWAGHPNFYFRISKFSLPWLDHPSVPKTYFLDRVPELPADLSRWVLKPLYSFAGLGVKIGPSRADFDAIPASERENWVLQERVEFTPVVETPHGLTKAEIRVMFIGDRPVNHIIRMGRGTMMGVDQNKNMEWVGASAALYHDGK